MNNKNPHPVYLKDYKPLSYRIPKTELVFELGNENTIVTSKLHVQKNGEHKENLELNGEHLKLKWIKINDHLLDAGDYVVDDKKLVIKKGFSSAILEIQVEINPLANTALEGLYKSGAIFCTQNEPEGFRRITYYIDRPDNMSQFTTKIIADKKECPVLLSNGNCVEKGSLGGNKHFAVWEDPFLKPSYLFALVGGDLGFVHDIFKTKSGRKVDLYIYTEKGDESRCEYAMDCLKRSMKWDEDVFGLEYDLDVYMIVAVHSFNMGAMENKGLNIFNTSAVLADEKTATDDNYLRVETVICHEYFHNWTGNRVTLRDWFQLTLKEGLTVFRDQEFSSDMNSRAVKRIEDVLDLKARQFPEDAGPNAHPIQPDSYIEINNFYTATIYDKGAEIIRMIHTLLGAEGFRKGMDKYFDLYDGQAVTTEGFIYAMEVANNKDLTQFRKWYKQVGTPVVHADFSYDPKKERFSLTLKQSSPKSTKVEPLFFPFQIGLIGGDGKDLLGSITLEVKEKKQTFTFDNIKTIPLPSLNRNFSAPVIVKAPYSLDDLIFLMKHDTDLFNRYDAAEQIMTTILLQKVGQFKKGNTPEVHLGFLDAFKDVLINPKLDGMFIEKTLTLPSEAYLADQMEEIDIDGIAQARDFYLRTIAITHEKEFLRIYESLKEKSDTISKRKLKALCLKYLSYIEDKKHVRLIYEQFKHAKNMTDSFAALSCLNHIDCLERQDALDTFYKKWHKDPLVITKWFVLQGSSKLTFTFERLKKLMNDAAFDIKLPNIVRALLGSFIDNHRHFHAIDGSGYAFIADQIITLDALNPLVAARLAKGFEKLGKLDKTRQKMMKKELKRIIEKPNVSSNVYEIIHNILEKSK